MSKPYANDTQLIMEDAIIIIWVCKYQSGIVSIKLLSLCVEVFVCCFIGVVLRGQILQMPDSIPFTQTCKVLYISSEKCDTVGWEIVS